MEPKTQTGYLLLADISGFTSFVAQTEIDHAHLALSFLLETIMEKISSLLIIFQLEGDAVFAYLEERQLQEGQSLLELIDQTYLAFREKALALYSQATCPCKACRALPTLDLKFLVHHQAIANSKLRSISLPQRIVTTRSPSIWSLLKIRNCSQN